MCTCTAFCTIFLRQRRVLHSARVPAHSHLCAAMCPSVCVSPGVSAMNKFSSYSATSSFRRREKARRRSSAISTVLYVVLPAARASGSAIIQTQ